MRITREQLGLAASNFDSSLRLISYMIEPNFEVMSHVLFLLECFSFRIQKPPRKFGVESGLIRKWLIYIKIISHGYMS